MSTKANFEQLNALDPVKLAEADFIRENWIKTYAGTQGESMSAATMVYEREAVYYKKAVSADDKLKKCTNLTLYSAFLEAAITGLSAQPGQKSEAYYEGKGIKTGGDKRNPVYTQTAFFRVTAYGELNLRIRAGQITRMFNPVVVYEGDIFQPTTNDSGELIVKYTPQIPRRSKKIVGCYVRILLPDGSSDFKWLLEDDVERLRKYATIETSYGTYTNPLYSSAEGGIDPGFLETKTIKHAMRAYTRLRVGENVLLEDETTEEKFEGKKPFGETPPPQQPEPEPEPVQIDTDEPF